MVLALGTFSQSANTSYPTRCTNRIEYLTPPNSMIPVIFVVVDILYPYVLCMIFHESFNEARGCLNCIVKLLCLLKMYS